MINFLSNLNGRVQDKEPYIPDGFERISAEAEELKIKHRRRGDIFKWFSVEKAIQTLPTVLPETIQTYEDGIAFGGESFSPREFHYDKHNEELLESIRTWGGVYLPVYHLSKGSDELPSSVPDKEVWNHIPYSKAATCADQYGKGHLDGRTIFSGLLPGWLFDLLCIDLISKNVRTWDDMTQIHLKTEPKEEKSPLEYKWLESDVRIWTSEMYGRCRVIRIRNYPTTPKANYIGPIVTRTPMFTSEKSQYLSFQMFVALS